MEWLSNNWLLVALLAAGGVAFLTVGRGGCGMSHGGHAHGQRPAQGNGPEGTAALTDQGAVGGEHAGHAGTTAQAAAPRQRHGCC